MNANWLSSDDFGFNFQNVAGLETPRTGTCNGPDKLPWYEVLSVPPDATRESIKSAYREAMRTYHPDTVARLGQKLRDLAEQESKRINEAYSEARAERGF